MYTTAIRTCRPFANVEKRVGLCSTIGKTAARLINLAVVNASDSLTNLDPYFISIGISAQTMTYLFSTIRTSKNDRTHSPFDAFGARTMKHRYDIAVWVSLNLKIHVTFFVIFENRIQPKASIIIRWYNIVKLAFKE
uniref:Uncharacterized protein n=1 Tax=Romanomermis culicivorax TaxID=13658 RepID=A0A915L0E2_ROMCU